MKACTVVPGRPDSARVEEVPDLAPAADEVVADGLFVGVCGTDVEIVTEGYGEPPPGRERLTLFHESLGRVRHAPEGAGFAPGDLVVGIVRRRDPVPCACCARGEWDFCRNGRYTERGIKGLDGYGAHQWQVPVDYAVRVDPSLGDLGVLTEPCSVVAKAWEQVERIGGRACFAPEQVLVTGAGPIGLLAALIGVQKGYAVTVLDRVTSGPKPALVRDLGARYTTEAPDRLDRQPDVVVECTGIGQLVFDVLRNTAPNAVVALTGISSGQRTVAAAADAINKELVLDNDVVFGSVNANRRHYEAAADALHRADRDWLARLVSRRVPLESWPQALTRGPDDVKVVVDLQT